MTIINAVCIASLLAMVSFGVYRAGFSYQEALTTTRESLGGH